MYKCYGCGHIFEEGEQATWKERHGLEWGYEIETGCPLCNENYGEAVSCSKCGGAYLPDELVEGLCEECIEDLKAEYRFNVGVCNELFVEKEKVEISSFLANFFSSEQIDNILANKLKELSEYVAIDCKKYMDEHQEEFLISAIEKELI